MKKILLLFGFFVVATTGIYAQVGIGTTDPVESAQLEVWAENKGILIPRVDLTDLEVYSPIVGDEQESLLVYNKATVKDKNVYPGYYYWYNKKWNRFVSKEDFNNKEIVKEILKGSGIVTYDGDKNTFVTYTQGGTATETVDIIKAINSNTTTTKINTTKIEPSDTQSRVLATIEKGGEKVVDWIPLSDLTVEGEAVEAGKGVKINGVKKLDKAVLKTFTITVDELGLDQIKVPGATSGTVVTIGKDGTLTTTQSVTLNQLTGDGTGTKSGSVVYVDGDGKVQQLPKGKDGEVLTTEGDKGKLKWKNLDASSVSNGKNLSSADKGGIVVTNGDGVLLKNEAKIGIAAGGVTEDKLATDAVTTEKIKNGAVTGEKIADNTITPEKMKVPSPAEAGDVLKINEDGDGVEWGKLDADNIEGKNLSVSDDLEFLEGDGKKALLKATKIGVKNVDISKVTVSNTAGYENKLLTINSEGKFSPTNTLPADVKVEVNNIKGEKGGTATKVVVIDPATGNATTTSITELVSNTVKVGNGLKKDANGKIMLGGDLEEPLTTITAAKDKKLAIDGLTNTGTISTAVDKVVVLGEDNVMHTVSATAFKGSGDYKVNTTKEAEAVETGNVMTVDGGKPVKEKMVTIPIEVTKATNRIEQGSVSSMVGFGSYSNISEIRIFSKGKISITDRGVTKERQISFLAAALEGSGAATVIIPSVGGGTSLSVYPGEYYVVIKFFE